MFIKVCPTAPERAKSIPTEYPATMGMLHCLSALKLEKTMKTVSCYSWRLLSLCLPLAIALTAIPAKADNVCPGTGSGNTCYGFQALFFNTTGQQNTANGYQSLFYNTTGSYNTAIGFGELLKNTTGSYNSAIGYGALFSNTSGSYNTANGHNGLTNNTTGSYNTANGDQALNGNTTGYFNTANGYAALFNNTSGYYNTANGDQALFYNSIGSYNTAYGANSLANNTAGFYNTAHGNQALNFSTGNNNIGLGHQAGYNLTTGSNNVDIANQGVAGESGVIRIGTSGTQTSTFIAGINGVTASGGIGVQVFINSNGQLGTLTSSRRFKRDINNLGSLSDRLLKLRPVSFRYKQATEQGEHPLQYGLIAEEVAKVFPELVQYDKEGKPFTVYYHLLTPLMLSELQHEHAKNQQQQAELVSEKTQLASLRSDNQLLRQQLTTLQAQQEQMLKAVSTRLNELERAVQVNGKAPQAPATVLTALPSSSR